MRVPISILIPTKNESRNLAACLETVQWADELVVVDSHSEDDTAAIAEQYGARVVQFDFNGTWPKKRNWALENIPWKNEWVFILDADERLPPEIEEEIRVIVTNPNDPCTGYWVNRRFYFLGTWLKHAYFPNWNLRMFKHAQGRYENLVVHPTCNSDNEIHEQLILEGKTGYVKAVMDHYAFPTVEAFIDRHNDYSNWEAAVALSPSYRNSKASGGSGPSKTRRSLKLWARGLPFRPLMRFLYVYVWQRGFLDGWAGFHFARLHGMYELMSVIKTYELKRARAVEAKTDSAS